MMMLGGGELLLGACAAPLWGFGAWLDPFWTPAFRWARGAWITAIAFLPFLVLGGASLVAGLGLWSGRRWALRLAWALAVLYVPGGFGVVGLGLLVMLNDPEVRARFATPPTTSSG